MKGHNWIVSLLCGILFLTIGSQVLLAQEKQLKIVPPSYFFQKTLSEATSEVVSRDAKFMLFVYEQPDSLAAYYLDTLFKHPKIAHMLRENFVCIAADTSSVKGQTLVRQFRIDEFPAIVFADRRGQEFYSIYGMVEQDRMFDAVERAIFK